MLNLADLLPSRGAATAGDPRENFWFQNLSNTRRTGSGETISPQRALTLSAYFACIRVIAEDVAKLPVHVFESMIPRGKRALYDHPVYRLLHDTPNPEQTAYTFRETMTQWALGWGNGYAEIERDQGGRPVALWPIHPSRVRLLRINGKLYYRVSVDLDRNALKVQVEAVDIPLGDMLHIRGMGSDLVGYSIAAYAAESIGVALAAEGFGAAFFKNGASASGVLTHPGKLSETAQDNLRASWKKLYGGATGEKLAILEEGVKYEQISIPPDEAQFLETRQFQVEEICRWFRVSPHKIQHLLRSTFSNIEHLSIEHVTDTLMPWLVRWEQEVKRSLIIDPKVRLAHNVNGLLRGDANARANWYRTMVNIGALSPNDVREYEDENPISGPGGDEYYMQMNMSTLARIAAGEVVSATPAQKVTTAPADDGGATADAAAERVERRAQFMAQVTAMRGVFLAEADRILRNEVLAVQRATGKPDFPTWAATFFRTQADFIATTFEPLTTALCRMGADVLGVAVQTVDMAAFAAAYCTATRDHMVKGGVIPAAHTPSLLADEVIGLVLAAYGESHVAA